MFDTVLGQRAQMGLGGKLSLLTARGRGDTHGTLAGRLVQLIGGLLRTLRSDRVKLLAGTLSAVLDFNSLKEVLVEVRVLRLALQVI